MAVVSITNGVIRLLRLLNWYKACINLINDKKVENKDKKKYRHSTTVYLPRKDNDLYVRGITARSRSLYGVADTLGKNSKYIIQLVRKDLREAGILNSAGEFDLQKMSELEAKLKLEAEKNEF